MIISFILTGINLLSFLLMGWDKYCAKKNYWRISENSLIGVSFLGGSIGTLLGMYFFRHKTQKLKFKILVPLSIITNIIMYIKLLKLS